MVTILVIEDESAIRDIVTEILESSDLHAITAEHPDQVGADVGAIDLVLADLVEQQGHFFDPDAVRAYVDSLRHRFAAPVVLFTAHGAGTVGDPAAFGAAGVIGKPFDVDDFAARVSDYLDG